MTLFSLTAIFKGFSNKIESGNILKQIISQINKISFVSTDDIHTMTKLYEDMLLEMIFGVEKVGV
jgi:type I restriction enzyme M protein